MQFSLYALTALLSVASAQQNQQPVNVTIVDVARNGTRTFSPNNIKVPVGGKVQFHFLTGNHTVTQSNFDNPCAPINMFANVTGVHSGFMPAAAAMSSGMVATFTITVNNTNPMWIYCAQMGHCQGGHTMVINENTAGNASRSLVNYNRLSQQAQTILPGGQVMGGNAGTQPGNGAGGNQPGGAGGNGTATAGSSIVGVPSTLGLFAAVAASFLL